jgi:PAS domain S-box-containing protein
MSKPEILAWGVASAGLRYGLSVLLVLCALLITLLLNPDTLVAPLFFLAILPSAWVGGMGPGLVAASLATLAVDYFFLSPNYTLWVDLSELPSLLAFFLSAVIVSWWSAGQKRTQTLVQRARDELEAKVQERTEDLSQTNKQLRTEIAERQRAEETLREQANLLNLTHDTIFVRDMSNVITYWNRGAQELYGWTEEETMGKRTHDLLQTVFPVPLEAINGELLRRGRWEGDLVHTKRDGTKLIVASRWALQQNQSGRPVAVLETNNDITERKRADEEIRKLNEELEQRVIERTRDLEAVNKELEAFAYSVSHDLRAPLRHTVGYAELLQKNASSVLDEKSRRYTLMILESAKRMGILIDDLLAFSRVGRAEIQKTIVNLEQVLKEALSEIRQETDGRNIVWRMSALPNVYGDRSMLRLVLVNLISNAVKFTRTRPQAEIEIGCADGKHDEIVVFIRDNGVGFDMKYVNKLFGVFQRLHRTEDFEGTGIGLATVQRIVHSHGGRVWADSQVNEGATFYFSVPKS